MVDRMRKGADLNNMIEPPLLQFEDPNEEQVRSMIPSLLENLERSTILTSLKIGRLWQRPTFKSANSIEMASRVLRLLEQDRRNNIIETQKEAWKFDYLICRDSRDTKVLQLLTRLFHPTRRGNIFYGRYVRRSWTGTYVLWADD